MLLSTQIRANLASSCTCKHNWPKSATEEVEHVFAPNFVIKTQLCSLRCSAFNNQLLKTLKPKPGLPDGTYIYFRTKNENLDKFRRVLKWKMFVYFMAIWKILRPFGIFYGHLVYFMAIWYILWQFGIFLPFWYIVSRKNWQPWPRHVPGESSISNVRQKMWIRLGCENDQFSLLGFRLQTVLRSKILTPFLL
jgi:hypothetical protein